MLHKYSNFTNNRILNESYNIKEVDDKLKHIVSKTRESLLKIKYQFYNIYSNDKAELMVGGVYYTLMQFDPTIQNEEINDIDKLVFLVQVKILKENKVKILDNTKSEVEISIFDYKILGFSSSVVEYVDLLNKYKDHMNVIKTTSLDYVKKINEQLKNNQINGFYLFSKDYTDVKDIVFNKLKIDRSKFQGRFLVDGDKKSETFGSTSTNKKSFSMFKEKTNPNNLIVYLGVERDFYLKILNLKDNKIYKLNKNDFNSKYLQFKNKNNEQINVITYFNSKITELEKTQNSIEKVDSLNKYIEYILNILLYTKDELEKSNLELLIKNIVSVLGNIILEVKNDNDLQNISIINKIVSYSENNFNNFNKVNTEIALLFNKLKNKK